jgi:hypothetical protein
LREIGFEMVKFERIDSGIVGGALLRHRWANTKKRVINAVELGDASETGECMDQRVISRMDEII